MKYRCCATPPSNPKFVAGLEEGWITTKTRKWNRLGLSVAGGWTYRHVRQGPHKDWYDAIQYREVLEEVEGVSDQDFMWKKLLESDKANHAITLGLNPSDGRQDGLLSNHAYSLLRCVQVGEIKLLAIRNPWGHREWNGARSDDSEEWQQHPEVAAACQGEGNDDGIFGWKSSLTMKIIEEIDGKGRTTEAGAGQNAALFTVLAKPHSVVTLFLTSTVSTFSRREISYEPQS